MKLVSNEVPRLHEFVIPSRTQKSAKTEEIPSRIIKTVSLTSSSGAANISISKTPFYKHLKNKNPNFNTYDFREIQYREFFK